MTDDWLTLPATNPDEAVIEGALHRHEVAWTEAVLLLRGALVGAPIGERREHPGLVQRDVHAVMMNRFHHLGHNFCLSR